MSHIIILFGEMGAGKNFLGEKIAKRLGYQFIDGDVFATPEMVKRVSKFKLLNRTIVCKYVMELFFQILPLAINNNLVIAQALYSDEDRVYLEKYLGNAGHKISFKWIKPNFWQHMKQLYSRPKGFLWVLYCLINKLFFERPKLHYSEIIKNNKNAYNFLEKYQDSIIE